MEKLIIIGGGAAGMMSAISVRIHNPQIEVTLIEKNEKLGKKILVCGAGRCNLTNSHVNVDRYYGAPPKFISTVINQFDNKAIYNFFSDLGIELYEEEKNGRKKGKIFPVTNQASTITDILESELERLKIKIVKNCEVIDVEKSDNGFITKTSQGDFQSDALILSSGGLTYHRLGATGFGYKLAQKFGHSLVNPVPSALPIEANHYLISKLAGLKLMAEVVSIIDEKEIKRDTDEVMFTKYGLSGPAILNISREISVQLNRESKDECYIKINFMPGKNKEQIYSYFQDRWTLRPNQKVIYSLYGVFPNKISNEFLNFLQINPEKLNSDLSKEEKGRLISLVSEFEVKVLKTRGWDEAEFTAGGVNTKEIDASSLESKIVQNLYFAGEIVNVDGDVGGFNLSWAWSSGWVAGQLKG